MHGFLMAATTYAGEGAGGNGVGVNSTWLGSCELRSLHRRVACVYAEDKSFSQLSGQILLC